MTLLNLLDWLNDNNACDEAIGWVKEQYKDNPDATIKDLWYKCPKGEWLLWCHQKAGTDPLILLPVVYRAVNRALGYASKALDKAGIKHTLLDITITSKETAAAASDAALDPARDAAAWAAARDAAARDAASDAALDPARDAAAWAAARDAARDAARAVARAAITARAANAARAAARDANAAAALAAAAAWAAARAAARDAEHRQCAEDCRELLPIFSISK